MPHFHYKGRDCLKLFNGLHNFSIYVKSWLKLSDLATLLHRSGLCLCSGIIPALASAADGLTHTIFEDQWGHAYCCHYLTGTVAWTEGKA